MALDIFKYLSHLDQERYRAVILHATPEKGVAVTKFVQKVCTQMSGKYVDLLDLFIQNQELRERIDSFGPEQFHTLLVKYCEGTRFLIIDRADMILDTWSHRERQDFFRLIKDQWDSYKDGMKAKLVICLQTSQEINGLSISDSQGHSRVLRLSDFNDIL